jgi:hypothetical protein
MEPFGWVLVGIGGTVVTGAIFGVVKFEIGLVFNRIDRRIGYLETDCSELGARLKALEAKKK